MLGLLSHQGITLVAPAKLTPRRDVQAVLRGLAELRASVQALAEMRASNEALAEVKATVQALAQRTEPIREGERQIRTTKQRALVKSLMAKALKGDMRAMTTLITLIARLFGMEDTTEDASVLLSAQEEEQLAVLEARLLRRSLAPPGNLAIATQGGGAT